MLNPDYDLVEPLERFLNLHTFPLSSAMDSDTLVLKLSVFMAQTD